MKFIPLLSIALIIAFNMNFSDAFFRIRTISNESYMHPRGAETKMRNTFNAIMKFQNKLWTKILLERLTNKNIGTNEVIQFARNQAKNCKEKKIYVFEQCIYENMKIKLTDAEEAECKARKDMVHRKIELKKVVREDTVVDQELQRIINFEWNRSWHMKSLQNAEKIKWLSHKQELIFKEIKEIQVSRKDNLKNKNEKKTKMKTSNLKVWTNLQKRCD